MNKVKDIKVIQNPFLRLLFELVISIIIALLLELAANMPALTQGYQLFCISDSRVTKKGKLIYSQEFDEPVYVNKICVKGSFSTDLEYQINVKLINDFDIEEVVELEDNAYAVFQEAYTNINEKVKSIKVTFPDTSKVALESVSISNEMQFSESRFLFWILVCFLILLILLEHNLLIQKTEVVYAVFAIGFGILLITVSGPRATTWDEEAHYSLIYKTNFQAETVWSQAAWQNSTRFTPDVNTEEELEMLKAYMNQQGASEWYVEPTPALSVKNLIVYFPMIIGQLAGKLLGLSYVHYYNLGRFANLIFCTVLLIMAIRLAKRKKILISVISLMPTVLFQSSMYTYDGVIFACMTLGFVLWMNEMEKEKTNISLRNLFVMLILFAVGSIAKPVYVPAFLLVVPLIGHMLGEKKNKRRICILIAVMALAGIILAGIYLIPIFSSFLSGNMLYGGDTRGGETAIIPQMISVFEHPIASLKMLIHEIFTMDNFRNFSAASKNRYLVSNLMFLNLYALGILKDAWSLILIPLLAVLFFAEPVWEKPADCALRKRVRKMNQIVFVLSIILTWIIMYLTFTPVGSEEIEGVQARYYLPLILPAALAVWNEKIVLKVSKVRFYQLAFGAALLLTGTCIYQCLILGRAV